MSKKFKHLLVPEGYRHYWSKYPQGYTILEALMGWIAQVDDMVDSHNQLTNTVGNYGDRLDDFIAQFDTNLQSEVETTLSAWQNSGFLDVVIDQALQTQMDTLEQETQNKLDDFATQLAQLAIHIIPSGSDDSQSIRDAIDSLGGQPGLIKLPRGNVIINSPIPLKNNVKIVGDGKNTIIKSNRNVIFTLEPPAGETLRNVTLSDFIIDASDWADSGGVTPIIKGNSAGNLEHIVMERITADINGDYNSGITFSNDGGLINNLKIRDCHIVANGRSAYGINIRKPNEYVWVQNNYVSLTNSSAYNNIAVYGDSKYFHVNGNTCVYGGHSPIAVSPGSYGEIIGNYVKGANYSNEGGIEVEWKESHGGIDTSHHVAVVGNIIEEANIGILVTNRETGQTPTHNIVFSNNNISKCNTGFNVDNARNVTFANNIVDTSSSGVVVGDNVENLKVEGNKIIVNASASAIVFMETINDVSIISNDVSHLGASGNCLRFDKGVSNAVITNNILKGKSGSINFQCLTTDLCTDISISNNNMVDFIGFAISLVRPNGDNGKNTNITIDGNVLKSSDDTSHGADLISVVYGEHVAITNNVCSKGVRRSVHVDYCNFVTISSNNFKTDYTQFTGSYGGIRTANSFDVSIIGNTVINHNYAGIIATSDTSRGVIANNIVNGSSSMGISVQGGTNNFLVIGNLVSNVSGTPINDAGTSNELFNNKIVE